MDMVMMRSHLLADEIKSALDSTFGLGLVLLDQHRADKLVNSLIFSQLLEFLYGWSAVRWLAG